MLRLDQFLNATRALILARAFTQEMPGNRTHDLVGKVVDKLLF